MKNSYYYITLLFCTLGISKSYLQAQVGFGINSPNPSAALHIYSTDKGFLMPRMTEAEKKSISTPAIGLTIYQTDGVIPGIYYYSGTTHGWLPWYQVGDPKTPILNPNTIKDNHIQAQAITGDKIADGAIDGSKIQSASVTSRKIAKPTLTGAHIKSGEITVEKLSQSGASDGDVWTWDGKSWKAGPLSAGLKYVGIWNANTNSPDLTALATTSSAGDFYVVSVPGSQTLSGATANYDVGDWVIYTSGKLWEKVDVQYPVKSVFGRNASSGGSIITPQSGDYTWAQIDKTNSSISSFEDVDLGSPPLDGQVLLWDDASKTFKPKYEHGHPLNPIQTGGLANNSITGDKIKSHAVSGDKIANNTITSSKIADRAITEVKIKGPLSLDKLSAAGLSDGSILVWSAIKNKWQINDLSGGISYQGTWDAGANTPALRDGDPTTGVTGHFYTVINPPTPAPPGTPSKFDFSGVSTPGRTLDLSQGDWVFYSGSEWTVVKNTAAVVSIFGRTGDVIAQPNDYSWDLLDFTNSKLENLSDVTNYSAASDGQVLGYTAASRTWEAINDRGSASDPIDGSGIANGAIRGWHIGDGEIKSVHIKDNAITSDKIVKNSISGDKIKDKAITSTHIKTGSIGISKVKIGAITRTKIRDGAIDSTKIKDGSVSSGKIADNAVTSSKIAAGSINEFKFALGAVTGAKLKANSITARKISNSSVSGDKIADRSIAASKIRTNAIDSTKIKNGTITSADIADNAIDEFKIKDKAITTDKVADNTITSDNILNGSISSIKINPGAVTDTKIKDNSLTTSDFADGSVTGSKINNNEIDSRVLANELVIGDGSYTTPNSKAVLEIRSSTKGFLPPRMTSVQRDAITSGATTAEKTALKGLIVYDTTVNKLYFWNGSDWKPFY